MENDELVFVRHLKEPKVSLYRDSKTDKLITCKLRKRKTIEDMILRSLQSKRGVSKLLKVEHDKDCVRMYYEYVDGLDGFDYVVDNGPFSEDEAKKIFVQLVDIVSELHDNGYVHRDLKLENMIVDSTQNITLIDWEFACEWKSNVYLTTHCGSPEYAAPEMLSGKCYIGPEVDIYSMGVILYELLTQCSPFHVEKWKGIYYHTTSLTIPDRLSEDVARLLRGMLNPYRSVRWTMEQIKACKWLNK